MNDLRRICYQADENGNRWWCWHVMYQVKEQLADVNIDGPSDELPGKCPEKSWLACSGFKKYEECKACFEKAE